MKLIADSGSTKTDWYLLNDKEKHLFSTLGLNPVVLKTAEIARCLKEELLAQLQTWQMHIKEVYFYGAGCSATEKVNLMQGLLQEVFPNAQKLRVASDLWASIFSSCGDDAGICCILGTGSNACVYDGQEIIDQLPSLGYILGDEGSALHIGKSLVSAYFYREMPITLAKDFELVYSLQEHQFVQQLYSSTAPNRFLASFSQFASRHRQHPFIQQLLSHCFSEFVERQLLHLKGHSSYPIHAVGSIAAVFEKEFTQVLQKYHLNKGLIQKSPFPKLLDYHLQ